MAMSVAAATYLHRLIAVLFAMALTTSFAAAEDPMKGADYVALAGELFGMPRREAQRRAHEVLTYLELEDARYRRLEEQAASLGIAPELRREAIHQVLFPPTGTIHCSALNEKGEISGCTTTSGLAYKLPGRCGDSPVIGAGCYTDQDVGSAGATGSGEENIKVAGAHTIVENMRHGMSPQEAGMEALKHIVRNYNSDMNKLRFVDMTYYILRKDGAYAGVSLWEGYEPGKPHKIAVHDGTRRSEKTLAMFKGWSQDFPPPPTVPEDLKKEYLK